jgi:hypothetical protein
MRRGRVTVALACAAAVLGMLAGCSASPDPVSGGPLGPPENHDGECIPAARPGAPDTEGADDFTNTGSVPLTITRVSLDHPHHLALLGTWLVPTASSLVGAATGFPPTGQARPAHWAERQRPGHFRLMPGKPVEIVVGVAATARPRGISPGVRIWYRAGGTEYVRQSTVEIIVSTTGCQNV